MNKDLNFECVEDFADYIIEKVEFNEGLFVSVVGKFEETKDIIKEMFYIADVDFENLDIKSHTMSGYEDEYVLDCWCDDGVIQIGCEPAKRDGEYLHLVSDEIYLLENVSSKIIPSCKSSRVYFVNFDEDCDECCCGCCDCCGCDDEDDDIYGFTVNNETDNGYSNFTYYSSNPIDKSDIRNILKEFGF